MTAISAHIPIRTVTGLNAREHWRVRAKRVKAERSATFSTITLKYGPPRWNPDLEPPYVVTLTRITTATRLADDDNLQGACKAVRDAVADYLGMDDADKRITWRYEQERGKAFGINVLIESA